MWPFNTGDCLIKVTTWAGLTVYDDLWIHKTIAWNENDKMILVSLGHKRKLFDSQVLTELSWLVIIMPQMSLKQTEFLSKERK